MPRLTDDDLSALEALERRATSAQPWLITYHASSHKTADIGTNNYNDQSYAMTVRDPGGEQPWCDWKPGNLELAIASRNALPALLSTIRAERADNSRIRESVKMALRSLSGVLLTLEEDDRAWSTIDRVTDELREALAEGESG